MKIKNGETFTNGKLFFFSAIVVAALFGAFLAVLNGKLTATVSAQQDPFLAQRINQIESRLNRIETESRRSIIQPVPRPTESNETEIRLLRSQIETMQLRLAELECGIVKLDERTLSNAARQALRKSASANGVSERCRANPNEPLQFMARP